MASADQEIEMDQPTTSEDKGKEPEIEPTDEDKENEEPMSHEELILTQMDAAVQMYRRKAADRFFEALGGAVCGGVPYLQLVPGSEEHSCAIGFRLNRGYNPSKNKIIVPLKDVVDPWAPVMEALGMETKETLKIKHQMQRRNKGRRLISLPSQYIRLYGKEIDTSEIFPYKTKECSVPSLAPKPAVEKSPAEE